MLVAKKIHGTKSVIKAEWGECSHKCGLILCLQEMEILLTNRSQTKGKFHPLHFLWYALMSIHFIHFSDPSFIHCCTFTTKAYYYCEGRISTQTWDGKMRAHFYDDAISNVINHLSNTAAADAVVVVMMMRMLMWILRNQKFRKSRIFCFCFWYFYCFLAPPFDCLIAGVLRVEKFLFWFFCSFSCLFFLLNLILVSLVNRDSL